mgnify:CR=1 FL=1
MLGIAASGMLQFADQQVQTLSAACGQPEVRRGIALFAASLACAKVDLVVHDHAHQRGGCICQQGKIFNEMLIAGDEYDKVGMAELGARAAHAFPLDEVA